MSARVWTDEELATEWQCDLQLLRKLLLRGHLEGFKVGRDWRIRDDAKQAYELRVAERGAA